MEVTDWPTSRKRRTDYTRWNFFFTGMGTGPSIGPRGAMKGLYPPSMWPGAGDKDPAWLQPWEDMHQKTTLKERLDAFSQAQKRLYDNVYNLKFGDYNKIQAVQAKVHNFAPYRVPRFWNVWKD